MSSVNGWGFPSSQQNVPASCWLHSSEAALPHQCKRVSSLPTFTSPFLQFHYHSVLFLSLCLFLLFLSRFFLPFHAFFPVSLFFLSLTLSLIPLSRALPHPLHTFPLCVFWFLPCVNNYLPIVLSQHQNGEPRMAALLCSFSTSDMGRHLLKMCCHSDPTNSDPSDMTPELLALPKIETLWSILVRRSFARDRLPYKEAGE